MQLIIISILVFIFGINSCDQASRWLLFKSACRDSADCKRFEKSLSAWEDELKKRPNYKELTSKVGIDLNDNGLRDDVELYIDKYMGLEDRHWMARHPFKLYGAIIDIYSNIKPNYESLRRFKDDHNKQVNCSSAIFFAEGFSGGERPYIYAKIRYLLLKTHKQKTYIDNGYLPQAGHYENYNKPRLQIFSDILCGVPFEKMGTYKDKIFTWSGRLSADSIRISLEQYEKFNGKKDRKVYEEYLD